MVSLGISWAEFLSGPTAPRSAAPALALHPRRLHLLRWILSRGTLKKRSRRSWRGLQELLDRGDLRLDECILRDDDLCLKLHILCQQLFV
jgi:hypothetical protein